VLQALGGLQDLFPELSLLLDRNDGADAFLTLQVLVQLLGRRRLRHLDQSRDHLAGRIGVSFGDRRVLGERVRILAGCDGVQCPDELGRHLL